MGGLGKEPTLSNEIGTGGRMLPATEEYQRRFPCHSKSQQNPGTRCGSSEHRVTEEPKAASACPRQSSPKIDGERPPGKSRWLNTTSPERRSVQPSHSPSALRVSLDYLVGQVDEPTPTREIACDLKAKIARIRDLEEGHPELLDPNWHEHVGIDEVDTTVGADSSAGDEKITRRLKFPYPWLRRHGLRAHMCRIVRVAGEAMEPTVPDGSAILIDAESTERRDGRIFVVRIRDELLVRRLVQDPEAGWLLFSDHPDKAARPTVPWPEEATIVGEVKWLGRTFT